MTTPDANLILGAIYGLAHSIGPTSAASVETAIGAASKQEAERETEARKDRLADALGLLTGAVVALTEHAEKAARELRAARDEVASLRDELVRQGFGGGRR